MLQLPKKWCFHILDPKNATEPLLLTKSKFYLKKSVYLDILLVEKYIILKSLGYLMHQSCMYIVKS
jgi:hypothetical protein